MASTLKQLADAVVTLLNAGSFSQAFTAEHIPAPYAKTEDISSVKVGVVVPARAKERSSRGSDRAEYTVEIHVLKKFALFTDAGPDATEFDGLVELAEELADFFGPANHRIDSPEALWTSTLHDPVVDGDFLFEGVFGSLITLAFKL
jgi:hypothetical protein